MQNIEELDFKNEVLSSSYPVCVCFTAPWCRTCYPACLIVSELSAEYRDRIKFVEVNIGKYPILAEEYQVKVVPTVLIFHNGQPVNRILSYQEKSFIKDTFDAIVSG